MFHTRRQRVVVGDDVVERRLELHPALLRVAGFGLRGHSFYDIRHGGIIRSQILRHTANIHIVGYAERLRKLVVAYSQHAVNIPGHKRCFRFRCNVRGILVGIYPPVTAKILAELIPLLRCESCPLSRVVDEIVVYHLLRRSDVLRRPLLAQPILGYALHSFPHGGTIRGQVEFSG